MIQLMISLTGKLNYTVIGSTKNNILHLNLREQVTITIYTNQNLERFRELVSRVLPNEVPRPPEILKFLHAQAVVAH